MEPLLSCRCCFIAKYFPFNAGHTRYQRHPITIKSAAVVLLVLPSQSCHILSINYACLPSPHIIQGVPKRSLHASDLILIVSYLPFCLIFLAQTWWKLCTNYKYNSVKI